MTPQAQARFSELLNGYRHTALLYVAARLRLAETISAGLCDYRELARHLSVHEDALYRVLRGLAAMKILAEESDGRFLLTELGCELLGASGQAILAGEEYLPAWGSLLHSVRTGGNAFEHAFGMTAWEHRRQNAELGGIFDAMLFPETALLAYGLAEAYDFSGAREVMDVGGGTGGLLHTLLQLHPHLRGALFDLPHVVERSVPLLERVRILAGDFFVEVPAGADVYVLKSVLHDWDDAACVRILQNCRRAMMPENRLLIIERALPRRASDDPATIMLDLHMLAVPGGRERFAEEYQRLALQAGLEAMGQFAFAFPSSFRILVFQPRT